MCNQEVHVTGNHIFTVDSHIEATSSSNSYLVFISHTWKLITLLL